MKRYIGISILSLLLLLGYLTIQNNNIIGDQPITYDDEQEGLSKQVTIRFSHVVAENTPKGLAAQKFAELVSKKTNGKVKVEVYPNGILYSDENELEALQHGKIEMMAASFSKLTDVVPQWKVLDLPFIFENEEQVEAVFTGPMSKQLLSMIQEKNIKGLAFWSNGFKQMTSARNPLLEPDDFHGQTFRTMPGSVLKEQFNLLDAHSVVMPFNDVFYALESREIDGQENTISNIYTKSLYKVQDHLTLSNHGYLGYAVIVNQSFWESLPEDIRLKIDEALEETTTWNMQEARRMNRQQLSEIKKNSDIHIDELSEAQRAKWMDAFQPLYRTVEEEVGKELMIEIKEAKK
ncbi:MAG TPA: DctP family TRAP transporter solute-binding subunit [Chondromyces sp.]|nr:DctP family TRAP transporter solute-binding subunit [Chondromyces sp.]